MKNTKSRREFVKATLAAAAATVITREVMADEKPPAFDNQVTDDKLTQMNGLLSEKIEKLPEDAQVYFLESNGATEINELSLKLINRYPTISPSNIVNGNSRLKDLLEDGRYSASDGAYQSWPGHDKIPFEKITNGYQSPGYSRFSSLRGETLLKPRDVTDVITTDKPLRDKEN